MGNEQSKVSSNILRIRTSLTVNEQNEYIVCGYIRNECIKLNINFPIEIAKIIQMYYIQKCIEVKEDVIETLKNGTTLVKLHYILISIIK